MRTKILAAVKFFVLQFLFLEIFILKIFVVSKKLCTKKLKVLKKTHPQCVHYSYRPSASLS